MSDVVQNFSNNSKSQPREPYELDEALAIIQMIDVEGLSLKKIAAITANSPLIKTRTVHSLRYKFKENQLTNHKKGVKYIRSLRQFNTDEELFVHFGIPFVDAANVALLITGYKGKLVLPEEVEVTA